jgi:hypothetical protein
MTAQIADRIHYDGVMYAIAGVCGGPLFEPQQIGIIPIPTSTACWRGYHCDYTVEDQRLSLSRLVIGIKTGDVKLGRVLIFGREPKLVPHLLRRHRDGIGIAPADHEIADIREPVKFTGGLLLGNDFLTKLYVHMGFHPAYKYRHVVELVFDEGRMTHAFDRSEQAALIRDQIDKTALSDTGSRSTAGMQEFIERSFSLDYGFSRFFKH